MVRLILIGKRIYNKFSEDEMTVYAAQVSFFVILSFVPFLMLLLTAVQMIPGISKADFLEIAMDIDADGVHVGQSDMEAGAVREKLGPDKILGVSARTVEQALLAQERGADYLGVGAVFATGSKADAAELPHETLKAICEAVSIPVVAIGGITAENISQLKGTGICGVAVISAIYAQNNIKEAAEELKEAVDKIVL